MIVAAVVAVVAAQKGGKTGAASNQRPFYGTKTPSQPEESREAALPAFVEPPPAPNPEPNDAAAEPGMPYSFSYTADATDGGSARQETSDGSVVRGSYMLDGPDGIKRVVHYIADKDGFRATITTNEPGTESMAPSGVLLTSSQLPASEIALQYGPGEPLRREPQPSSAILTAAPLPVPVAPLPAAPIVQPAPLIPIQVQPAPVPLAPVREAALSPSVLPRAPVATRPNSFGFREAQPSARAAAIKGKQQPEPQRKTLLQAPIQRRPLPSAPLPVQRRPAPTQPQQPIVFEPQPLLRGPLPPSPPLPAPLQLRPQPTFVRSAGKVNAAPKGRPFFAPIITTTTQAPVLVFDEQQQSQEEETQQEQQQEQQEQAEEEPQPQQQELVFDDAPQQQSQLRAFLRRRA